MGNALKICVICGEDCAGRPRIKDPKGRYYHRECHEQARERAAARRAAVDPDPPQRVDSSDPMGLLDSVLEESAPPPVAAGCPSCGRALSADDVVCTNCGFNMQSGHATQVAVERPKKEKAFWRDSDRFEWAGAILGSPFGVSMVALAVLGVLFMVVYASQNVAAAAAFLTFANLLVLTSSVVVLVVAFREGVAQGLLTLFIPFYVFYFVFAVTDNQWARWFFVVSLVTRVASFLFEVQMTQAM